MSSSSASDISESKLRKAKDWEDLYRLPEELRGVRATMITLAVACFTLMSTDPIDDYPLPGLQGFKLSRDTLMAGLHFMLGYSTAHMLFIYMREVAKRRREDKLPSTDQFVAEALQKLVDESAMIRNHLSSNISMIQRAQQRTETNAFGEGYERLSKLCRSIAHGNVFIDKTDETSKKIFEEALEKFQDQLKEITFFLDCVEKNYN